MIQHTEWKNKTRNNNTTQIMPNVRSLLLILNHCCLVYVRTGCRVFPSIACTLVNMLLVQLTRVALQMLYVLNNEPRF